ncbi:hypothetical protein [Umezawaea beigongshangensis]|uniref:hypothetical protein n=1 Tax=Umezawaea beigongshangensis TaxID=2780383 RepID=UPI0018F1819C|nr:hypothetical protein [Umezawaea beigongshangensis]
MGAEEQQVVPLHAGFDVAYRGFHRRQVLDHVEHLEEQLRFTSADRAEALAQAADLRKLLEMTRRDLEDARARIERLEMSPGTTSGATERLHRMLLLAEDESADLRLRAEQEVQALRQRTAVELAALRREAEEEVAALHAACARRAALLDEREIWLEEHRLEQEEQLRADAERLLSDTAEECERARADSRERIAAAQRDFDLATSSRRAEVARHLAEQEALTRTRAEFLVHVVCREMQRRIEEVRQRCEEIVELRERVAAEFASARAVLGDAAERVRVVVPEQSTGRDGTPVAQRVEEALR